MSKNFNSAGAFPATPTNINGGSMQWNFSAANQEVDFFNSAFAAAGFNSFYWEQQTGPMTAATLLAKAARAERVHSPGPPFCHERWPELG